MRHQLQLPHKLVRVLQLKGVLPLRQIFKSLKNLPAHSNPGFKQFRVEFLYQTGALRVQIKLLQRLPLPALNRALKRPRKKLQQKSLLPLLHLTLNRAFKKSLNASFNQFGLKPLHLTRKIPFYQVDILVNLLAL